MKRFMLWSSFLFALAGCQSRYRDLTWSWVPVAPLPKTCWATVDFDSSIVSVGGTYWVTTADGQELKVWSCKVHQFDTSSQRWKSLPDYPRPVGYAFAAVVGRKIYVIGGRGDKKGNAETFVLDFALQNPAWIAGPSLPRARWQHKGGVIDGIIYIIGGVEGDLSKSEGTQVAEEVLALDTHNLKKGWYPVAVIPEPQAEWFFGTACGHKLYLFGGLTKGPEVKPLVTEEGTLRTVENNFLLWVPQAMAYSLDVSTGQWQKLTSLPTPKCSAGCIGIDDRHILIAGGVDLAIAATQTPGGVSRLNWSSECWLYDTEQDRYTPLAPLRKAVCDQGLAYVNGRIYVIGGEGNPFKTRTDLVRRGEFR